MRDRAGLAWPGCRLRCSTATSRRPNSSRCGTRGRPAPARRKAAHNGPLPPTTRRSVESLERAVDARPPMLPPGGAMGLRFTAGRATRPLVAVIACGVAAGASAADAFRVRLTPVPIEASTAAATTGHGAATAQLDGTKLTLKGNFA